MPVLILWAVPVVLFVGGGIYLVGHTALIAIVTVKRLAKMRRPLHRNSRDFSPATQRWILSQRHRTVCSAFC